MQCPKHQLILGKDPTALRYFCPWPDCDFTKPIMKNATGKMTPSLDDLFGQIKYEVQQDWQKVTVKAILPLGFSMREFTRIYNLEDAKDFDMTDTEYIELQKREMLKDLLERIKKERMGL